MRIAIIGSGISGLACAYFLQHHHDITIYEANDYPGGHTHTHELTIAGKSLAVDSGFIVYNRINYPCFSRLLDRLGVESEPTSMSFSVRCDNSGLEYNGTSINGLFAQRRNLLRPAFYRMILDILRFNRDSPRLLEGGNNDQTLSEYVRDNSYSRYFEKYYLIPMCAALWSAPPQVVAEFPIRFLVKFFQNHGMLAINDRPQWLVVSGGSQNYVRALLRDFNDRVKLNTAIKRVERASDTVMLTDCRGNTHSHDQVIFACHSDQALQILADATPSERAILGAMPYQSNNAVMHTDARLLPRHRRAWASWNYHIPVMEPSRVAVTYYMNSLQGLQSEEPICVTLNHTDTIAPDKVIKRLRYDHPLFTTGAVQAQSRWTEISGRNRTHYCGAYWGNGFHEDGVQSAIAVSSAFGVEFAHA